VCISGKPKNETVLDMLMATYFEKLQKSVNVISDAERHTRLRAEENDKARLVCFCDAFKEEVDRQLFSMLHEGKTRSSVSLTFYKHHPLVDHRAPESFTRDIGLCESAVRKHLAERYGVQRIYYGADRRLVGHQRPGSATAYLAVEVNLETNGIDVYAGETRK
jgi:hypothetical protein